jgi:hypothetical protein
MTQGRKAPGDFNGNSFSWVPWPPVVFFFEKFQYLTLNLQASQYLTSNSQVFQYLTLRMRIVSIRGISEISYLFQVSDISYHCLGYGK